MGRSQTGYREMIIEMMSSNAEMDSMKTLAEQHLIGLVLLEQQNGAFGSLYPVEQRVEIAFKGMADFIQVVIVVLTERLYHLQRHIPNATYWSPI